jgi:Helix-turn-helix domain/Bacterial regulatory proteins, gntR family
MAEGKGLPKYARVAAAVRGQITDGTLRPGQPAPSGAALSRVTGYSTLTCRRGLRALIADGVLTPGPSRNARPRVAGPAQVPAMRDLVTATRALSSGLAARRRANGLTQPELAGRVGVSVTTVGHAETGRLWQSRQFWEQADAVLCAGGGLLRLHDAYREACAAGAANATRAADAAAAPGAAGAASAGQRPAAGGTAGAFVPPPRGQAAELLARLAEGTHDGGTAPWPSAPAGQAVPACVLIVWSDGTVTTVRPPETASPEAPPAEPSLTGAPQPETSAEGAFQG